MAGIHAVLNGGVPPTAMSPTGVVQEVWPAVNGVAVGVFRAAGISELKKLPTEVSVEDWAVRFSVAGLLGNRAVFVNRVEPELGHMHEFCGTTIRCMTLARRSTWKLPADFAVKTGVVVFGSISDYTSDEYLGVEVLGFLFGHEIEKAAPVVGEWRPLERTSLRPPVQLHFFGLDWVCESLRRLGVTLDVVGDKLVPNPKGKIGEELGAAIRFLKPRLIMQAEFQVFWKEFVGYDGPLLGRTLGGAPDLRQRIWDHCNAADSAYTRGDHLGFRTAVDQARTALKAATRLGKETG